MEPMTFKLPGDENSAKPILFGYLMDLAASVVLHYRSDFYHDAHWIHNMTLTDDAVFFYGIRNSGTLIGTDEELLRRYSERLYKITSSRDDRLDRWIITIEKV